QLLGTLVSSSGMLSDTLVGLLGRQRSVNKTKEPGDGNDEIECQLAGILWSDGRTEFEHHTHVLGFECGWNELGGIVLGGLVLAGIAQLTHRFDHGFPAALRVGSGMSEELCFRRLQRRDRLLNLLCR